MIKGLRLKFICINMIIVTLMLCVIFGLTLNLTHSAMEEDSLEILRSAVAPDKAKQNGVAPAEGDKKVKQPKETETVSATEKDGRPAEGSDKKENGGRREDKKGRFPTFTLQYDSNGYLLAQGSDMYDLTDTVYLQEILENAKAMNCEHGVLKTEALRFLRVEQPGVCVYVFTDISGETEALHSMVLHELLIGAIAFVAFLFISIFLSRWAAKPVERAWEQQQQFIADASHELKTPLTVILTNAELMWDNELEPAEQKQCVGNVLEMSRRMRVLTEEMLNLARAENAQEELMDQLCPMDRLIDDAVLSFEALLFEQGLELEAELAQEIRVKGNETQLRQLVEILLDNARKYSLPGKVELSLQKHNNRSCLISLSNPAEPMSEEDLKHLCERFYRADQARSSDGSFGLGLSIAEGIVRRHKGSISATYNDGKLSFNIQLPTA